MPGCGWGFSVAAELTVASDPFDPDTVRPDELALALERRLKNVICTTTMGDHTIKGVHVYRVAPTLASLRRAILGEKSTPWVDKATGMPPGKPKLLPQDPLKGVSVAALRAALRRAEAEQKAAKPAVKKPAPKKKK